MIKILLTFLILFSTSAYATPQTEIGIASYYGKGFWGRKTASGHVMQKGDMTAASRTLPLGTKILVTNLKTKQSKILQVNDRGPYVKGRILDIAETPAMMLNMKHSGTIPVEIKVLELPKHHRKG